MAGLIDVGILKPELATSFATGYQQAEQTRQQNEMNQLKLDQLKQDRAMLTDLQTKLRAAGQSDDPNQFFKAMIQTGNPDYMAKGYEGLQRYKELQRAEQLLGAEFGTPAVAPAAAPANALAPSVAPAAPSANALATPPAAAPAAPAAAPANALVAPDARVQELRRKIATYASVNDPRLKALAPVYQAELNELVKPQVVSPGATVFRGGQSVFTAPAAPTELDRLIATRDALPPGDPRRATYDAAIKKQTTHAPAPTMINVQEKAEAGAYGKMLVEQYDAISKQAGVAARTLPAIEANLGALNKGLDTGFGTEAKAAGARILGALGVKDAEKFATDTQTFQSNAIQAVLQKQLEQKGPQTESDAQRIEQIGAQLGKTKDANRFILDLAKEQLRRDVEQRNFYANWKRGPGKGSFDGAEDAWFAGEGGKSLFDRPALKKYAPGAAPAVDQIPGQRPVPAPTAAPAAAPAAAARTVVRTGTLNGRRVVQYSDGSTAYAD